MLSFLTTTALTLALLTAGGAHAQDAWIATLEGGLAVPPVDPQARRFGPGGALGGAVHAAFADWLLLGAGLDGTILSDGAAPSVEGVEDPGVATIYGLTMRVRLRPLAPLSSGPERATGLWLEIGGGAALSGALPRPLLTGAAGWTFAVDDVGLGPMARWQTVFEVDNAIDDSPAHVLVVGLQVSLFDARAAAPHAAPVTPAPLDSDADGLRDEHDRCPAEPEDVDGFEDDDGCPDPDDDADGVPDVDDACRLEPEDDDGFEDDDGCPDPDNDADGILDVADHCPNEPERVNGIDDEDGCHDEGLVELVNDHVILEEHVLFDFGSSTIEERARPTLHALADLVLQHPEWTRVRVEGHACTQGSHGVNQRLSEERARAVRDELIRFGVAEGHVDYVGLGESQPRAWGETEDVHSLNRRVELVVVSRSEVRTIRSPMREGGEHVEVRPVLRPDARPEGDE